MPRRLPGLPFVGGARLLDALMTSRPTSLWVPTGGSAIRDVVGGWHAAITGSPVGIAAPEPIGPGLTFSGSGQYATTSTSIPNVTTSVSLLAFIRTTNSTAANRYILGRHANFALYLNTGHGPTFAALQNTTASHCAINAGHAANNGEWHLVAGTFDGTTAWSYMQRLGLASSQSSSSRTGTWNKGANALEIGAIAAGGIGAVWPGDLGPCAFWADRVLPAAEIRWIGAVAFGG